MADRLMDAVAREIFLAALAEDRCGELLVCLFQGGSATIDKRTGRLVLASADVIAKLGEGEQDGDE